MHEEQLPSQAAVIRGAFHAILIPTVQIKRAFGLLFDGGRRDGGHLEGGGSANFLLFAALGQLLTWVQVFRRLHVLASRRHRRGDVHRSAISARRTAAGRAAGVAATFAAAFRAMEAAFEALPQRRPALTAASRGRGAATAGRNRGGGGAAATALGRTPVHVALQTREEPFFFAAASRGGRGTSAGRRLLATAVAAASELGAQLGEEAFLFAAATGVAAAAPAVAAA